MKLTLEEKFTRKNKITKTIVEKAMETDEETAINWGELELHQLDICIN